MFSLGMVLLELLTRKKACFFIYICLHMWIYVLSANVLLPPQVGKDGFAKRVPTSLFVLDMETIMAEVSVAAPYLLVNLMKQCLAQEVW